MLGENRICFILLLSLWVGAWKDLGLGNESVCDRLGSSEVSEVSVMISQSEKDRLEYITQAETH